MPYVLLIVAGTAFAVAVAAVVVALYALRFARVLRDSHQGWIARLWEKQQSGPHFDRTRVVRRREGGRS